MDKVIFSDDYYMYKAGFGDGIADFIINAFDDYSFMEELKFDNIWDYGYLDACYYCFNTLISGNKIDLSIIDVIIVELYTQRVLDYNRLYNKEIPAFTLILNDKKR